VQKELINQGESHGKKFKLRKDSSILIKYRNLLTLIIIILGFVSSFLYLGHNCLKSLKKDSDQSISLAKSFASQINVDSASSLSGSEDDLETEAYLSIKNNFEKMVENMNVLKFTYLLGQKGDDIVYLVDSGKVDAPNYYRPGHVYAEATEEIKELFISKKTILLKSLVDEKGTWRSVVTPVLDSNNNVIALFRTDYSFSEFRNRIIFELTDDIAITVLFLFFVIFFVRSIFNYQGYKNVSEEKKVTEALYHSIFDQVPLGAAIIDGERFIDDEIYGNSTMNFMFQKILGRTSRELAKISSWSNISHPDDLEGEMALYRQFKKGKIDGYTITKRFLKPDGTYIWAQMWINRFIGQHEDNPYHLCIIEDITKEKEIAAELKESERSKSLLLSNLPGMAYRYSRDSDKQWTVKFASSGCLALTGFTVEEFLKSKDNLRDFVVPEHYEILEEEWFQAIANKRNFRCEYQIITANGERKWVIDLAQYIQDEKGKVIALEGIMLDIDDRKEAENQLKYTSEHDSETGLLNYTSLQKDVERDYSKHVKQTIIDVNLNTFVRISVIFGHFYILYLLNAIAEQLRKISSDKNTLYRAYGNHLVFYVKNYKDRNELLDFAKNIKKLLEEKLKPEGIGAGIGVVEVENDGKLDLNKLTKRVYLTSSQAIARYPNEVGIVFFDRELEVKIQRQEDVKRALYDVVDKNDTENFYMQFQPILDLKTNKIVSFEALARLKNEELGNISPLEFIPIAEETKLIIPLGWNIFRQSFNFLKKLIALGYTEMRVSINVSAIQLFSENFTTLLFKLMDEMQILPTNVNIELTESVFSSDLGEINKVLNEIHSRGLTISIDDFGTGYSSLAREHELNVDCLKIDKYFVDKLMEVSSEEAIASDIIAMAHKRGHGVIAEGVEYEKQKQYLIDNKCDKIQGYLISKPLSQENALNLLKEKA